MHRREREILEDLARRIDNVRRDVFTTRMKQSDNNRIVIELTRIRLLLLETLEDAPHDTP